MSRLLSLLALAFAGVGTVTSAAAQSACVAAPDQVETSPGAQSQDVALDAPLLLRFPAPVLPDPLDRNLVTLFAVDDGASAGMSADAGMSDDMNAEQAVAGRLQRLSDHVAAFLPDELLRADTLYRMEYRDFTRGDAVRSVPFRTGRDVDRQRPQLFFGDVNVDVRTGDAERCGGGPGTFVVELRIPPTAIDDSDLGGLEYFLYLTRAEGLRAPRLLQRLRRQGALSRLRFAFELTAEESSGPVCATVRVVDAVGKVADEQPELCFDPFLEAHFQPLCQTSTPGAAGAFGAAGRVGPLACAVPFLVACGLVIRRRRVAIH